MFTQIRTADKNKKSSVHPLYLLNISIDKMSKSMGKHGGSPGYSRLQVLSLSLGCFLLGLLAAWAVFLGPSNNSDSNGGSNGGMRGSAGSLQALAVISTPTPIIERIVEVKKELEVIDSSTPEDEVVERYLALDKEMEESVRNCFGNKCFDEKVPVDGPAKAIDRIGLLAPSGSGGEIVFKIVQEIAKTQLDDRTSLVLDTHVPTYGYGKNHGWSRIIRLYRNLIPHSLALLHNSSMDLMDLQIKQLMRWHCRLNHVAAHTKMLSILTDELAERPAVEVEKILTFIGIKTNRAEIAPVVAKYKAELLGELGVPPKGPRGMKQLVPKSILPTVNKAIEEEWSASVGLSAWPCLNFRDIDQMAAKRIGAEGQPLVMPMTAPLLAPNCSDPFVKCTVGFDRKGG